MASTDCRFYNEKCGECGERGGSRTVGCYNPSGETPRSDSPRLAVGYNTEDQA